MADMRYSTRDQRRVLRDRLGAFGRGWASEGADLDRADFARDAIEPTYAGDVDQQRGRRQPHVERGDKALAAREQASVLVLAEQCDRFLDRPRLSIGERRRLHARLPEFFLIVPGITGRSMYKAPTKRATSTTPPSRSMAAARRAATRPQLSSQYRSRAAAASSKLPACGRRRAR